MKGTTLTAEMQEEKDKFISKHKIKKSAAEALGKLSGNLNVVSIPRKRSEDDADEGALATLEQKTRSKKTDKKGFSNKRQRTN